MMGKCRVEFHTQYSHYYIQVKLIKIWAFPTDPKILFLGVEGYKGLVLGMKNQPMKEVFLGMLCKGN